jgi:phospholipase C
LSSTPYRAARFLLALAAFVFVAAIVSGDANPRVPQRVDGLRAHGYGSASSPIQHVIVLIMENRTVDNLFAGYYGKWAHLDIANPNGSQPLREISYTTRWDPDHTHAEGFTREFESGHQDGWGNENFTCPHRGCEANPTVYAYLNPAEVQNYVSMAQNFAIADHVFQGNEGPSLPAHQYLIAGQSGGLEPGQEGYAIAENPAQKVRQPEGPLSENGKQGTGCSNTHRTKTQFIDMTTPYPGIENMRDRACVEYQTIFDLLDTHFGKKAKSWRFYTSDYPIWNAPLWVNHLYKDYVKDTGNVVAGDGGRAFQRDLAAGTLSQVTFLTPCYHDSDHPLSGSRNGPFWAAYMANLIGESRFWNNTALFVVWDDWGGWYDHVKTGHPKDNAYGNPHDPYEWGFRVPLIALSPYVANRGLVDHTPRSSSAILRYIEDNFGLPTLGGDDEINDDLSSLFNYSRAPLPYVPVSTGSYHPGRDCKKHE